MLREMETLVLVAATCVIMLLVAVVLLRTKWRHSPRPGHVR